MLAGHRWEYQLDYLGYKCVPLPFGGVESHQWCVGCGCLIDDKVLYEKRISKKDEFLNITLDILADSKGYKPIESGSLAEFNLHRRNKC